MSPSILCKRQCMSRYGTTPRTTRSKLQELVDNRWKELTIFKKLLPPPSSHPLNQTVHQWFAAL